MGITILASLGVLLGGPALILGFSEEVADWIVRITFWGGLIPIGLLVAYLTEEWLSAWLKNDSS